jgi:hypothetical protein
VREDIRLLTRERDALRDARATRAAAQAQASVERDDLLREQQALRDAAAGIARILDLAERDVLGWRDRLPPSLARAFDDAFPGLTARVPPGAGDADLGRRAEQVIAALATLEDAQSALHVAREVLAIGDDPAREYEVLYLGLARGFALRADGRAAAVGDPGPDGWRWTPRPELTRLVGEALAAHRRRATRPVALPVRFEGHAP